MKQLTKLEILNETIAFYLEDTSRRSTNEKNDCVYNGPNGTHCAVGRCLLPVYQEMGEKLPMNADGVFALVDENECENIDEMLQEEYRGHDIEFWGDIQKLHDNGNNWDSGFTTNGEIQANNLIKNF